MALSISKFSKFADISTIDINIRYSISIYRTGLTSAASQAVPSVLFWVLRARLVYSFHIQIVRISPRRLLQEGSSEKKRM